MALGMGLQLVWCSLQSQAASDMRRKPKGPERHGEMRAVLDDDTVDGFGVLTSFVLCNKRSDLWHLPDKQALSHLVVPSVTLCGVKPYAQGAEVRRSWDGFEAIKVCTTCESLVKEF